MTRLTDSELDEIGNAFPTHLGEPKRSVLVQRLLSEVRAHRAAALTVEEVEALRWLAAQADTHLARCVVRQRALAVLTRLTGGAP